MRPLMRRDDLVHGVPADPASRDKDKKRHRQCSQWLGLAMPIRMILIRWSARHMESGPHQDRGKHIKQRFHPIGNQCVGVSQNAAGKLHHRQHQIQENTPQYQPGTGVGALPVGSMNIGDYHGHRVLTKD